MRGRTAAGRDQSGVVGVEHDLGARALLFIFCQHAALSVWVFRSRARCASVSNVFALSAHACVSTHLLPLPETVVVLVESLPRGNVVLAVKTREVGHAMFCVSGGARGLGGHAGGRGSGAERRGPRWAEGNVRDAASNSGTHCGCEWSGLRC